MAKKAYIGVDSTARKVKKGYVGVSDVARKIKKAYIGIGGVARPCWSGGEVTYYGLTTPLSRARCCTTNATICGNAIIIGDASTTSGTNLVEKIDKDLTLYTGTLPYVFRDQGGGSIGNYAVVGSGYVNGYRNYACAVNDDLTSQVVDSVHQAGSRHGDVQSNTHVLIGCGECKGYAYDKKVSAYDSDLVRTVSECLSSARSYAGGGQWGRYGVFAGGINYLTFVNSLDLVDENLTGKSTTLSSVRAVVNVVGVGSKLIIACGDSSGIATNVVDAFNEDLVRTSATPFPVACGQSFSALFEEKAVFCGGCRDNSFYSNSVCYDDELTQTILTNLTTARSTFSTASKHSVIAGDFLLVPGGWNGSALSTVEAFTLV